LNLEHNYGDSSSISALFTRSLQHNNPKKIYVHMVRGCCGCSLLLCDDPICCATAVNVRVSQQVRRSQRVVPSRREKVFDEQEGPWTLWCVRGCLCRLISAVVFPCQFWMSWCNMLMKWGKPDTSRATLTRYLDPYRSRGFSCCVLIGWFDSALTVLPRRKHVAVIQKHGILEYKSGYPERGRTIFEGLLSSEPKRTDLWSVYIDQEVASGGFVFVRRGLVCVGGEVYRPQGMWTMRAACSSVLCTSNSPPKR
jgi:hypothetical protein